MWAAGKHVVFGRVLGDGLFVLRKLENVATGACGYLLHVRPVRARMVIQLYAS